jgi:glycosyltransferase involved in cell wall biosynthesis
MSSGRGPSECLLCFAGVDWWYHPRGHSECQIMLRLSKEIPTLWINTIGMRVPVPWKTKATFSRYFKKALSLSKGMRKDGDLHVLSPLFLPSFSKPVLALNGRLVSGQVKRFMRRRGFRAASSWITLPTFYPALKRVRSRKVIFNRCDAFSAFPEVSKSRIEALEKDLLRASDCVVYANRPLLDRERHLSRNSVYLGHGIDLDAFERARRRGAVPPVFREMRPPVIGFYGSLDDYRIDIGLLEAIADRFPECTLLVIGACNLDISGLTRRKNVRYLGPIPHEDLADHALHFDVGVIPYLKNEWNEYANPIKLKEYLAVGFPVVATRIPALEEYGDLVRYAESREEFLEGIRKALAEGPEARRADRMKMVENDTWDAVARKVLELISSDGQHE